MSQVGADYLEYPRRRYGNDHDWFDWSMLGQRAPVRWPSGRGLAVWINVSVQHYPLNQRGVPFKVPNGMTMPYPDLRHYSLRDYGNRVGVFRVLQALSDRQMQAAWCINGELAERTPWLVERLARAGGEIIAHGWNMDSLHHAGLAEDEESLLISRTLSALEQVSGQHPAGWLSPARNQSWKTLDLLARHGLDYCLDWVNDEMPYRITGVSRPYWMLPLNTEIEDQFVMCNNLHSEDSWAQQVIDAVDYLAGEARGSGHGRMLGISLHPWLVGQPHRIACLERVLDHLAGHADVSITTPRAIINTMAAQAT